MRCFSSEGTNTDHLDRCSSTNGERGWTVSLLLPSRVLSIAFKRAQTAQTCLRCARDTLPQLRALASVNFCSTPGRSSDQLVKDDDAPGQVRTRERLRKLRDRAPGVSAGAPLPRPQRLFRIAGLGSFLWGRLILVNVSRLSDSASGSLRLIAVQARSNEEVPEGRAATAATAPQQQNRSSRASIAGHSSNGH